ncbi:hypothetical protein [Agromyces sp. Soil535]|uniref:hypothetical protein n=1 Tax=Agromyces sp. Soil535 TaxID=1736390 RepID=UPI0006F29AE2|nr:hypothetical protein [Agromyces sp. Soil535]KRE30206.1 hypothetical protein ASG80_18410 [Agromyces sp. Soil535]
MAAAVPDAATQPSTTSRSCQAVSVSVPVISVGANMFFPAMESRYGWMSCAQSDGIIWRIVGTTRMNANTMLMPPALERTMVPTPSENTARSARYSAAPRIGMKTSGSVRLAEMS